MKYEEVDGICAFSFNLFGGKPVKARVLTRNGGISLTPWNSLNLGGTVGDEPQHVAENKNRVMQAYRLDLEGVFDVWQVHSADWVYATNHRRVNEPHQRADIIITDKPGLTLMMRFADCVPLFVYDPINHASGMAHAGWQGTLKNVAGMLVKAMKEKFASQPESLLAGIGPAICMEHYPVGVETFAQFKELPGCAEESAVSTSNGSHHLDLKKINELQFRLAGVNTVENSSMCTACQEELWFSHRRDKGRTGRFGAFIQLDTVMK
ncbi:MAG: peptidoglycan editing factor PgeF [Anaerolinea sp.]|nr:peptidoglycan editing factor PgeF [Anaerolinea sp.]